MLRAWHDGSTRRTAGRRPVDDAHERDHQRVPRRLRRRRGRGRAARRQPAPHASPRSRSGAAASAASCSTSPRPPTPRVARSLATGADVVIETFRPGVVERFGLGYDDLAPANPAPGVRVGHRVRAHRRARGREGLRGPGDGALRWARRDGRDHRPARSRVLRRALHRVERCPRPRCTASSPRCSSASAAAVGQRVDTTLIQGFAGHDTWNAMLGHIAKQYPEAFTQAGLADEARRCRTTRCSSGSWSRCRPTAAGCSSRRPRRGCSRRSCASSSSTGCSTTRSGRRCPTSTTWSSGTEFYELLLAAVRAKTVAEWQAVFDDEPDVWAEIFRHGSELLDHPQLLHDRAVVTIADDALGVGAPARSVRPARRDARRTLGALGARARRARHGRASARQRRESAGGVDGADDRRADDSPARRRHRARARHLLRRAVRRDAAHRPRRARHQDRAARRRPDPPHHPVPRGGRGEGAAGQGERRRRHPHRRRPRDRARPRARRPTRSWCRSAPAWSSGSASTPSRCSRSTPTSST